MTHPQCKTLDLLEDVVAKDCEVVVEGHVVHQEIVNNMIFLFTGEKLFY